VAELVLLRVKLSNERKAYLAVLGLGVAALVVNQVLPSGGPASAAAVPSSTTPMVADSHGTGDATHPQSPAAREQSSGEVMSVAKRIEAMAAKYPSAPRANAFAPPASWGVKLASYRPMGQSTAEKNAEQEGPAPGYPTVKVNAVMLGKGGQPDYAQIVVPDSEGKPTARVFRVGQQVIGEVVLESLHKGGAVFTAPGGLSWSFAVGSDKPEKSR
jgi:hypothetical protein